MPTFVSNNGEWSPAKERAYDPEKGDIYEGKDRAALELLAELRVEKLGQDIRHDPELISRVRQMGFANVDEFLALYAPSKEAQEKDKKEKSAYVQTHKAEPKKQGVNPQGGGVKLKGGFGDVPQV